MDPVEAGAACAPPWSPAPRGHRPGLPGMSSTIRVGIAGTGSYVPQRVVPNAWFETLVDTSDEWIVQRTGIRERRFVAEHEATSDMALSASRAALEAARVDPSDLDL